MPPTPPPPQHMLQRVRKRGGRNIRRPCQRSDCAAPAQYRPCGYTAREGERENSLLCRHARPPAARRIPLTAPQPPCRPAPLCRPAAGYANARKRQDAAFRATAPARMRERLAMRMAPSIYARWSQMPPQRLPPQHFTHSGSPPTRPATRVWSSAAMREETAREMKDDTRHGHAARPPHIAGSRREEQRGTALVARGFVLQRHRVTGASMRQKVCWPAVRGRRRQKQ